MDSSLLKILRIELFLLLELSKLKEKIITLFLLAHTMRLVFVIPLLRKNCRFEAQTCSVFKISSKFILPGEGF